MGFDEYGETSSTRWLGIETVAANDPVTHSFEQLDCFLWGKPTQIDLHTLHHEFCTQELFNNRCQMAEC